jgi:hypothetical protein
MSDISVLKTSHSAMSFGDIISRSWRLYRLNFHKVILYAILPAIVIAIAKVLFNLPAALLNKASYIDVIIIAYPIGFIIFLLGFALSLFFNYGLLKAFYNILSGRKHDYKRISESVKVNLGKIFKLTLLIVAEVFVFAFLDIVFMFIIYIVSVLPLLAIIGISGSSETLRNISMAGFIVVILLVILPYIFLLVYQFQFCAFQVIIVAEEDIPVGQSIPRAYSILKSNIVRAGLFGLCLYFMWYSFILFFDVPMTMLLYYLTISLGLGNTIVYVFFSVAWSSIINTLLWPFLAANIAMYYYDFKIKTEGLDINMLVHQEINKMNARVGSGNEQK